MENLALCKSSPFQSAVVKSLLLARENHPKEAGFSCWMDKEGKPIVNEPVLGEDYQIRGHYQLENIHQPFTGYREGEGSQTILDFHTHPGPGAQALEGNEEEWLLAPSIRDISSLLHTAKQNRTIAELFGRTFWLNPMSVIGSPVSTKWALIQIDPAAAYQVAFEPDDLWSKAVWKIFERYHPRQAKRGTGPIARLFGPAQGPMGSMFVGLMGGIMQVPRFLRTSTKRYREFMEIAGVTWVLVDPSNFPLSLKFSYKIGDLKRDGDVYDFEGEDDDSDLDGIESDDEDD